MGDLGRHYADLRNLLMPVHSFARFRMDVDTQDSWLYLMADNECHDTTTIKEIFSC